MCPVNLSNHYPVDIHNYHLPARAEAGSDRVADAVKKSLAELAVGCVFTGITYTFIATPGGAVLSLAVLVGNAVFNILVRLSDKDKDDIVNHSLCELTCAATTGMSNIPFLTFIHEAGHACTAMLLLQNANPSIEVHPFTGGVTYFSVDKLTALGNVLGKEPSLLLISAAGAACEVGASLLCIVVAHAISDTHPEMSKYLNCLGLIILLDPISYALDAYLYPFQDMPGHDFLALAKGGVHPLAAIAFMALAPIVTKGCLILCSNES